MAEEIKSISEMTTDEKAELFQILDNWQAREIKTTTELKKTLDYTFIIGGVK